MLQRSLPKALDAARFILTDSEFVRNEIGELFPAMHNKVVAVYLGVDAQFHPRTDETTRPTLFEYGLKHGGYMLTVGTLEPRKNLIAALRAYKRLPAGVRSSTPLVIAGGRGWHESRLRPELEPLVRSGEARVLGYVPQASLPDLYAGARLFVFPSIYEGFGLPVLEAMASGVPVVLSDRASLPEVAAGAGLAVNPDDDHALAEAMARLGEDRTLAAELVKRGLERAAQLTWAKCARETLAVYRRALA